LNCKIRDNNDKGIRVYSGGIEVKNSLIYGNDKGVSFEYYGGGSINQSTIVKNRSFGIKGESGCSGAIVNSILWNNGNEINGFGGIVIYSCIEGGHSGTGNIEDDPMFANPDGNDFHLQPAYSPCIDKGIPVGYYSEQTDIDGEPRLLGQYIDMGADEARRIQRLHSGGGETWYLHIQDAINAVLDASDTIVVYPGTYKEGLYCAMYKYTPIPVPGPGGNCTIQSVDPTNWDVVAATVIQGTKSSVPVFFNYGALTKFRGFTVTGGDLGVAFDNGTMAEVTNCIIKNNYEGGVYGSTCTPNIHNCIIKENGGCGILTDYIALYVKNSLICGNEQGGIVIIGPYAGGHLWNNTIVNNEYGIYCENTVRVDVGNCIVWGNEYNISGVNANYDVNYCDVEGGYPGYNNLDVDPCFIPDDPMYHLDAATTPLWNAGNNEPNVIPSYDGQKDIDNEDRIIDYYIDIGADEANYVE
jgi:hypothetical protein